MPVEKAPELYSPLDGIKMMSKMLPFLPTMRRWKKVSTRDFSQRFKNPLLQKFFLSWGPPPGPGMTPGSFPMLGMLMALASMHRKSTGYPTGGSGEFSEAIARRYIDLGGEIQYGAKVDKILVENDRAVGIRLEDGSEFRTDYTISAADGYTTIFHMLEGKYIGKKIQDYYDNHPKFPAIIHVALGVGRTFDELPFSSFGIDFPLDNPVSIAGSEMSRLRVNHIHNFDPTLAPEGKTVLRVWFPSEYDYWKSLRQDPDRYKAEKEAVADKIVSLIDRRFPGLAEQVEMRDVATPITYERYTGNWHGSFEGWLPTVDTFGIRMSKTLPGLGNLYMTGQWVEPGGTIAFVAVSGRNVIQLICKQDKKNFAAYVD
jgi:phytoene dehydrogenase-like protein